MKKAFQSKHRSLKYSFFLAALCMHFVLPGISFCEDDPPDQVKIEELAASLSEKLDSSPSISVEYFAISKENRMHIRILWDKEHGYVILRLINDPEKPDWINFALIYKGEKKYWYLLSPETGEGKRFSLESAAEGWNRVFGIFFDSLSEAAGQTLEDSSFDTSGPFIPEIGIELSIDSLSAQIGVREQEHAVATWFSPEQLSHANSIIADGSQIIVRYPDGHTAVLDPETGLLIEEHWEDHEGTVFRSLKRVKSEPFEGPADFRSLIPGFNSVKIVDLSVEESFDLFYVSILKNAGSEMEKSPEIIRAISTHEEKIREQIYKRSRALWNEKVSKAISSPSPATETMEKVLKVILLPAYKEMSSDPEYSDLSMADFLSIANRSENLRTLLLDVKDILLPGEIVDLGKYIEALPPEKNRSLMELYRLGEKQYFDGFVDAYIEGLISYAKGRPDIITDQGDQ